MRGVTKVAPANRDVLPLKGVISTQLNLVESTKKIRRPGILDDVRKSIALVEHLDNFPTSNAAVIPSDVDPALTDIVSFQQIYGYSRKPGGTYVLTPFSARHIISMAQVMNRSVWFLLDPVSPLQFRSENIEIATIFARAGQPIYIGTMVMAGGTGPITLAGTVTLHNAELLAAMFLVYSISEQFHADIYNSGPHSMDPLSMICSFGSPNQALFGICMAQLGRYYGISRVANVGLTDALAPDFQCGVEKAVSAAYSALAGVQTIGCQGIVGADQGFSFEQLVLDNEWLSYSNYILHGVQVTEETIAADLIESVGISGNFLAEEHTVKHLRQSFLKSKLFKRQGWDAWVADGGKESLQRAYAFVEQATAGYRSTQPVCSPSEWEELCRLVEVSRREHLQGLSVRS